jgi:hypothetical protein
MMTPRFSVAQHLTDRESHIGRRQNGSSYLVNEQEKMMVVLSIKVISVSVFQ